MYPNSHIFWVHCVDHLRFEQGYRDFARNLGMPNLEKKSSNQLLQQVKDWLCQNSHAKWLIVMDNCDDASFLKKKSDVFDRPLLQYLPRTDCGATLFTSRNKHAALQLTGSDKCISIVDIFSEQDSLSLFRKRLPKSQQCSSDIKKLSNQLDYLPLAIT